MSVIKITILLIDQERPPLIFIPSHHWLKMYYVAIISILLSCIVTMFIPSGLAEHPHPLSPPASPIFPRHLYQIEVRQCDMEKDYLIHQRHSYGTTCLILLSALPALFN